MCVFYRWFAGVFACACVMFVSVYWLTHTLLCESVQVCVSGICACMIGSAQGDHTHARTFDTLRTDTPNATMWIFQWWLLGPSCRRRLWYLPNRWNLSDRSWGKKTHFYERGKERKDREREREREKEGEKERKRVREWESEVVACVHTNWHGSLSPLSPK